MTIRNCDADPSRTAPVIHAALATLDLPPVTVCPERVARDPEAQAGLARYVRWKRYGLPPDEADLDAFDVIEDALALQPGAPPAEADED